MHGCGGLSDDHGVQDERDPRAEILSIATEDVNGVWEAWWTVNSLRPQLPLSGRLALAEQALKSLVSDGLVELSRGSWEAQVAVPPADVDDVLREYNTWVADQDQDLVFFAATERGREAYGIPPD